MTNILNKRYSEKVEVKIGIESMVRCGGSCDGCTLNTSERTSVSSNFFDDDEKLQQLSLKLNQYVNKFEERFETERIDEIALNFGQGDHFLLNNTQIKKLVRWSHETFNGKAAAFITGSCVLSHEKFKKAVDLFHSESITLNQVLGIDIVFSPDKKGLKHFTETYRKNIEYVRRKFGHIDVVINMGIDVVRTMTPEDFCIFMEKNDFKVSAFQLAPTTETTAYFKENWAEIINWMKKLHCLWIENWKDDNTHKFDINYGTVFGRYFDISREFNGEISEFIPHYMRNRFGREIYIDKSFNIFYGQTGTGDFGLTSRFGFKPIGSTFEKEISIFEMFERNKNEYSRMFLKHFATDPSCATCEFNLVCMQSGISIYKKLKLETPQKCPFNIYEILSLTKTAALSNVEINNKCYRFVPVYLQNGAKPIESMKTEATYEDYDREIKF